MSKSELGYERVCVGDMCLGIRIGILAMTVSSASEMLPVPNRHSLEP